MNSAYYFDFISDRLLTLKARLESNGKLNLLDMHVHAEDFYRDLCNEIFGWSLVNLNEVDQNSKGIDLRDDTNKLIVQVSGNNTKQKIDGTLKKIDSNAYSGYAVKFIIIAHSAEDLRKQTYNVPKGITFDPKEDIYDVQSTLQKIQHLDISRKKQVFDIVKKELGERNVTPPIDSDLTRAILALSKTNFDEGNGVRVDNEFEINEKIEYNLLTEKSRTIIRECSVHQNKVEQIYSDFDREGANKSSFVLRKIHRIYTMNKANGLEGDTLFLSILNSVKQEIYNSSNRGDLSMEAIDSCAEVLVVDAFIRCRIFENPKGYQNVTA